jgi:hypothetical protein
MQVRQTILFAAALLFAVACATSLTSDIKVETETAPKANLKGYSTYAWLGSAEIVNDPKGQWEPPAFDADAQIRQLINAAMRNKGLTEVKANPDVLVGFAAGVDMASLEIKENPENKMQTLENVPKGALVVMLVDPRNRQPVWVGEAIANIQGKISADDVKKRLEYAVTQMFSKMER